MASHAESISGPISPSDEAYRAKLSKFPLLFQIDGLSGAELTDDVMIIHFFATWCSDFPQERALLEHISTGHNIPIYGINIMEKQKGEAEAIFSKEKSPYKAWGTDSMSLIKGAMGVTRVLSTFIVTKDNKVHWRTDKSLSETVVNEEILPLIEQLQAEYAANSNGGEHLTE